MKYPPTPEEIEERLNYPYRTQINRIEVRCPGISHALDPKTLIREPHRTLGINFKTSHKLQYSIDKVYINCDECRSAKLESLEQHVEDHPLESYNDPKDSLRTFYYKGIRQGSHLKGVYTLDNGTKFRYTYPDQYQEIRPPRKTKDLYGRPLPRRKPTPILSFTTSEEFYAYLDSILESTLQP